jgi:SAM-dependent methyltransferase
LGDELLRSIPGKTVIDFGCGGGADAIELARNGAHRVIGLEIREEALSTARQKAVAAGVADVCQFARTTTQLADIVVSVDAFEHFADPAAILQTMDRLLKRGGEVMFSFGPPWYHPIGGHLFSVFPWAHLVFSEKALIRWRSDFRPDGATGFDDVEGGLNRMSIRKFHAIVDQSVFRIASIEFVPVGRLRLLHNRLTREFTTACVRGRLVRRAASRRPDSD